MSDIIEMQRAMVKNKIALENLHDWSAVEDTFTAGEESFFDVVPLSAHLMGRMGIRAAYQILATAVPDMVIHVKRAYDLPGYSIREVALTGTHLGPYCGYEASGKKVIVDIACFFLFRYEGGKLDLVAERIYYDNDTLFQQIRGLPNAPGGIGLTPESSAF